MVFSDSTATKGKISDQLEMTTIYSIHRDVKERLTHVQSIHEILINMPMKGYRTFVLSILLDNEKEKLQQYMGKRRTPILNQ